MTWINPRIYIALFALAFWGLLFWGIHHHGYNEGLSTKQREFDNYLDNQKALIEKAKHEKLTIELAQEQRAATALKDYNALVDEFNHAVDDTERVRIAASMLCRKEQSTVPVAEHPVSAVPEASANSERTAATAETGAGTTTLSEFYIDALRDTAQCKALIDLVKTTQ